jgi:hypothetical protein
MDVGTFRDGFQWHGPLGEIDWWRFARWAGVHAHPLRTRVGTKPAATRPLADRELPTSLREDFGKTRPIVQLAGAVGISTQSPRFPTPSRVICAHPGHLRLASG